LTSRFPHLCPEHPEVLPPSLCYTLSSCIRIPNFRPSPRFSLCKATRVLVPLPNNARALAPILFPPGLNPRATFLWERNLPSFSGPYGDFSPSTAVLLVFWKAQLTPHAGPFRPCGTQSPNNHLQRPAHSPSKTRPDLLRICAVPLNPPQCPHRVATWTPFIRCRGGRPHST